ncbi:MAG: L,D-transpeptidase family protein [Methylotetracoccus sp.]
MLLLHLLASPVWAEQAAASSSAPLPSAQPAPPVSTAPQVPDPAASAIESLLQQGTHPRLRWSSLNDVQPGLTEFYRARSMAPAWLSEGRPAAQAERVLGALAAADTLALNPGDYEVQALRDWAAALAQAAPPSVQDSALFDVALSIAAARYANHLYAGRIDPRSVAYALRAEPKRLDISGFLTRLAASEDPPREFAALEPRSRLYESLKTALGRYRELERQVPDTRLNLPAKLKPGEKHDEVPKLRTLLAALGELPPEAAAGTGDVYDPPLVDAVKRFQQRHGLTSDGVIGKSTQAHLNVPIAERVKQIELALERLRWLPERVDGRHILVNIPSFELYGYGEGAGFEQADMSMNVIVGEAIDGRRTPVFDADMTYVVFRPHWNLPYKIAVKEMLPGAMRNAAYLSRHNIEIVSGYGARSGVHAATAENLRLVSTGALKLRQRPGPKNALGLVKFAFPNDNAVYLHGTPNQSLFSRARRDFSHGCIRVSDPVSLAEWVLKEDESWTRDRIRQAMAGSSPRTVTLAKPIAVFIFYSTVLADEQGQVKFFEDIYGHDRILREVLDKGFPYSTRSAQQQSAQTGAASSIATPGKPVADAQREQVQAEHPPALAEAASSGGAVVEHLESDRRQRLGVEERRRDR